MIQMFRFIATEFCSGGMCLGFVVDYITKVRYQTYYGSNNYLQYSWDRPEVERSDVIGGRKDCRRSGVKWISGS